MRRLFQPIYLLLFAFLSDVSARFTLDTCWGNDCVRQNSQGTWCYYPQDTGTNYYTACTGSQADMATVLQVHFKQSLSIAYYRGVDNSFLGGADWTVPNNPGVVRICLSGVHTVLSGSSGGRRTLCTNAAGNNVLANSPYCEVSLGPKTVSDGCYDSEGVNLNATTSAFPSATSLSSAKNAAALGKEWTWIAVGCLVLIQVYTHLCMRFV